MDNKQTSKKTTEDPPESRRPTHRPARGLTSSWHTLWLSGKAAAAGVAAGVVLPYLDETVRTEIFASDGLSPIERTYARAFKEATASGERSRGAHIRALEEVHRGGFGVRSAHPIRSTLAAILDRARDRIAPWSRRTS